MDTACFPFARGGTGGVYAVEVWVKARPANPFELEEAANVPAAFADVVAWPKPPRPSMNCKGGAGVYLRAPPNLSTGRRDAACAGPATRTIRAAAGTAAVRPATPRWPVRPRPQLGPPR